MSNTVRSVLIKEIQNALGETEKSWHSKIMSRLALKLNNAQNIYSFVLPVKSKDYCVGDSICNAVQNETKSMFDNVTLENDVMCFNLNRNKFIKYILEYAYFNKTPPLVIDNNKNVVIEFSSPNIAKPFHLGHLRSTVIGNSIACINTYLGNNVKKINYLGDWGTQFGFVQFGVNLGIVNEEEMKLNPIKSLYKAYVAANKLAETDSKISDKAREIFQQLETGNAIISKDWEIFKNYTVEELTKTYKRVGVTFDEYHWESMYNAKNITSILMLMEQMQLLTYDTKDRKAISLDSDRSIPILKSDHSTLYITRDIAAAIDRYEKNKFDLMYYVVDNAQTDHFMNLIKILKKMEMPWADKLKHVKFGRIRGMSTRKGTAVFLEDILNEMRDVMKEKQLKSPTTKVPLDLMDTSADILGISAVIINDLKQRRQKDYTFDWNAAFDVKGDTGVKLQYTHCRLVNLEENCGAALPETCNPSFLKEPEVDNLILLIGKFDETVVKCYEELEPCVLTSYLFQLSNTISKALKILRIKDEPVDLGSQRLLLFHTAKNTLAQGMKLLGLTPLNKM